jgi:hypothetical protein
VEFVAVKILGFEKYKGRTDVVHNSWFRLSNRITEDHEFFDFSDAEFKAWVYMLCLASQKNNDLVHVFYQHAHQVCNIKKVSITGAIEKLIRNKCIAVVRARGERGRYADDTRTCATDRQTDITRQDSNGQTSGFDPFWEGYPRKVKKGKAHEVWKRLVAKGKDPAQIMLAEERLRDHLKAEATEKRFIPHPTTFLNSFEDYLADDFGKGEDFSHKTDSLDDLVLTKPGANQ